MHQTAAGPEDPETSASLSSGHTLLLALSVAGVVANLYYIQPLLATIAANFHVSDSTVGVIAMLGQLGAGIGMFLFVPLGDNQERRGLIVKLLVLESVCVMLMACSPNVVWLALATFGVGLATSTVHVIVPYAAHLAAPERRGETVGSVMSGLLFGILLARTLSGLAGAWFGWRSIYWFAAAVMIVVAIAFRRGLPRSGPVVNLPWTELIGSTAGLIRALPVVREAALSGAVSFGAFSAFWTTLTFFLEKPPYHYGSDVAGLFGLVGAAGALGAPLVGRIADRYGARRNVFFASCATLVSFLVMYRFGTNLIGLIIGVVLLDLGVQAAHVSNQTRIYALLPEARSRLNMVYMMSYFAGGAMGSWLGTEAWQQFGWSGVCAVGVLFMIAGLALYFLTGDRGASGGLVAVNPAAEY